MRTQIAWGALDREGALPLLAQRLLDALRERGDLTIALARHEHQEVGVVDLAGDIEDLERVGLFVERRDGDGDRDLARGVARERALTLRGRRGGALRLLFGAASDATLG